MDLTDLIIGCFVVLSLLFGALLVFAIAQQHDRTDADRENDAW